MSNGPKAQINFDGEPGGQRVSRGPGAPSRSQVNFRAGGEGWTARVNGDVSDILNRLIAIACGQQQSSGKILDQLLKREREKLAEMEECVEWYLREVARYKASVADLEDLRSQVPEIELTTSDEVVN